MNTVQSTTPVQSIYILVEYNRRNGEVTYLVKKPYKVTHGNLEQGLSEIDKEMYDHFNYWNDGRYEDRDMADNSDYKEVLKPFWISHDEIMGYQGSKVIPKSDYDVLIRYL